MVRPNVLLLLVAAIAIIPSQRAAQSQAPAFRAEYTGSAQERAYAYALLRAVREGLPYVPGQVIVKFKAGASPAARQAVLASLRETRAQSSARWIDDLAVVALEPTAPVEAIVEALEREPEVEYAQPDYLARLDARPNDPGYGRQWNFDAIDLPRAWDINPGGQSVPIAIIDTGATDTAITITYRLWTGSRFDTVSVPYEVNPDLPASRIVQPLDFNPFRLTVTGVQRQPLLDTQGHGTHVAGTALQSTNNGVGFAGVAYNATLMPAKACYSFWDQQLFFSAQGEAGFLDPDVFGDGICPTAATVEAIRRVADAGAKVINLSLGGPGASPAYADAIRYAVQRGAFVAIAMGNAFEQGNPLQYPAVYGGEIEGAVAVGAIGRGGRRAYYSNTGSHIEVSAPGGDVREAGFNGAIFQAGLNGADFDPFETIVPRFDRYVEDPKQGTSMASPHVAGLAALLYSQGITSPAAIEAALERFARDLGQPGWDSQYGFGVVDARATLRGLGLAR
jgi:serine protease